MPICVRDTILHITVFIRWMNDFYIDLRTDGGKKDPLNPILNP